MKKINAKCTGKDRVICESLQGKHTFYYQADGGQKRRYLFETAFSGSVFTYFREKGRYVDSCTYGLTIHELYQFRAYHNKKLTHIVERLPIMIDYILLEDIRNIPKSPRSFAEIHTIVRSDERAA